MPRAKLPAVLGPQPPFSNIFCPYTRRQIEVHQLLHFDLSPVAAFVIVHSIGQIAFAISKRFGLTVYECQKCSCDNACSSAFHLQMFPQPITRSSFSRKYKSNWLHQSTGPLYRKTTTPPPAVTYAAIFFDYGKSERKAKAVPSVLSSAKRAYFLVEHLKGSCPDQLHPGESHHLGAFGPGCNGISLRNSTKKITPSESTKAHK